jgi:hypothetical protein
MFAQIILNTPPWVWVLLAFLIYRGAVASTDRALPLAQTVIIPVVMLGLSIQGILGAFGASGATMSSWLACLFAGAWLAWRLFNRAAVSADRSKGLVFQQGSWMPMALMLGIFLMKYAVGVLLALQPRHAHELAFVVSVCALYGLFNGVFIGKLLRVVSIYRRA